MLKKSIENLKSQYESQRREDILKYYGKCAIIATGIAYIGYQLFGSSAKSAFEGVDRCLTCK